MSTRTKIEIAAAIVVAVVFFMMKRCSTSHSDNVLDKAVNYKDSAEHYKLQLGNHKQADVASNEALVLDNRKQAVILAAKDDSLERLIKQFKDVSAILKTKQQFRVIHDTIPVKIPCDLQQPIEVNNIDSGNFKLKERIENNRVIIDELIINDTQRIVIGEKASGFLHLGRTITADVLHSNPHINTNLINAQVIKQQKWWEHPGAEFVAGIIVGGLVVHFLGR